MAARALSRHKVERWSWRVLKYPKDIRNIFLHLLNILCQIIIFRRGLDDTLL